MTKQPETGTSASDRPAFEITEEMLQAGAEALVAWEVPAQVPGRMARELAGNVFAAMLKAHASD